MTLLYASRSSRKATSGLVIRPLSPEAHLGFLRGESAAARERGDATGDGGGNGDGASPDAGGLSFLQCPSWGAVKSGWDAESLGWFRGSELVGAGLVLYRRLPRMRRCLAYLPEGPMIDWFGERTGITLECWLEPLVGALRERGAFTVKLGPKVLTRAWSATTVKQAIAKGGCRRLGEVPPDRVDARADELSHRLRSLGWRRTERAADGFTDFQPRYLFRLPLTGRDQQHVSAGFSQQWRRNIRLAERAGVVVERADGAGLPEFHRLYAQTAERDRFTPRPLEYFQCMFEAINAEDPERIRLYVARCGNESLAAATMVRVGSYAWYSYGASANEGRECRPSNALQWRMIEDCLADGMSVYDLRGISDTLDPTHRLHGLLRFKLGLGGEAVEYLGEWDYPISPALHRAFQLYLARR